MQDTTQTVALFVCDCKEASKSMSLHHEVITTLNADCAEFCPWTPHQDWLAVGTYQLDEADSSRYGRLYLYRMQCTLSPRLQQTASADMPGIFDVAWHQNGSQCSIAVALADGMVSLIMLEADEGCTTSLVPLCSCQAVSDAMAVSLDWASPDSDTAVVSSSAGTLSVLKVQDHFTQQVYQWPWHAVVQQSAQETAYSISLWHVLC